MPSNGDRTTELQDHIERLRTEVDRQDDAKQELSRQGRQMLRVIFLGISALVAAGTAVLEPSSLPLGACGIAIGHWCIPIGWLFFAAIGAAFLSALFYTAISGIDFVAPYAAVDESDTRAVLGYRMTGEQYYCHRIGTLGRRITYNQDHIRALEVFGAIGGAALIISLLLLLVSVLALVGGPTGLTGLLVLLVGLVVLLVVAYFLIPARIRKRDRPGIRVGP